MVKLKSKGVINKFNQGMEDSWMTKSFCKDVSYTRNLCSLFWGTLWNILVMFLIPVGVSAIIYGVVGHILNKSCGIDIFLFDSGVLLFIFSVLSFVAVFILIAFTVSFVILGVFCGLIFLLVILLKDKIKYSSTGENIKEVFKGFKDKYCPIVEWEG